MCRLRRIVAAWIVAVVLVSSLFNRIANALDGKTHVKSENLSSVDIALGSTWTGSHLFDSTGRWIVASTIDDKPKVSIRVIQSADGATLDTYQRSGITGCHLERIASMNRIGCQFLCEPEKRAEDLPQYLPDEVACFDIENGKLSRISSQWRAPFASIPNGFRGGNSKFSIMYASLGGGSCILESFGGTDPLRAEGVMRMAAINVLLLSYSPSSQLGCVLSRRKGESTYDCILFCKEKEDVGNLKELQRIENIKHAAVGANGQVLVVHEGDSIVNIYTLSARDGTYRFDPKCRIGVYKSNLKSIVMSPTGRFVLIAESDRCEVLDTLGVMPKTEMSISGGFDWALSDDGSQMSVLYRRDLSSKESRLKVITLR